MPQVSLYIDQALYMELRSKAKEKGTSLSSFVSDVLKEHLDNSWPEGFFDILGSWEGETIELPEDLPWSPNEGETL
ncbi:MAG: hypothetical protein FWD81_00345 [Methanomassiliicoccaceae archaeon]|nr:hypothetical protein [Methanomassiliicoccaceae archaeon]